MCVCVPVWLQAVIFTDVCVCPRVVTGGDQQLSINYQLPKVGFICDRQPKYQSCPFIKG